MSYGGLVGRTWRIDGNYVVSLPAATYDSCFPINIMISSIIVMPPLTPLSPLPRLGLAGVHASFGRLWTSNLAGVEEEGWVTQVVVAEAWMIS